MVKSIILLTCFIEAALLITFEERDLFRGLGGKEGVRLIAFQEQIKDLPPDEQQRRVDRYVATIPPHRRESYEFFKSQRNQTHVQRLMRLKQLAVNILGKKDFSKLMVTLHNPKLNRKARLILASTITKKARLQGQRRILKQWAKEEIPPGVD